MVLFWKYSAVAYQKVCLLRTHQTIIMDSMVGRSIASISGLGVHIYIGTSHLG